MELPFDFLCQNNAAFSSNEREVEREREREREGSETADAVLQDRHLTQTDATESWECRSPSSTSTTPNSSKSSDLTDTLKTTPITDTGLQSADVKPMQESSLGERCNGVMGVPITFMDKYCPEQFEIIGATESEGRGFSEGLWDERSDVFQATINGKKCYKRIFIKRRS